MSKVLIISGAGRCMDLNIDKAALAANCFTGFFEEVRPAQMEQQGATNLIGPMNVSRAGILPLQETEKTPAAKVLRNTLRSYVVFALPIFDAQKPAIKGTVNDISEKGFQTTGIPAKAGESRLFCIKSDGFAKISNIYLAAKCKWSKLGRVDGTCIAGFEIIGVSDQDRESIKQVIAILCFDEPKIVLGKMIGRSL